MNQFDRMVEKFWKWLELRAQRKRLEGMGIGWDVPSTPNLGHLPAWDKCIHASCWNGSNAQQRMMNMLSPHMSKEKFESYLEWMSERGCDTVHLILANRRDGENAGYCIYGKEWGWNINKPYCDTMLARVARLRRAGFAVVMWLFTDDSAPYAKEAKKRFSKYVADLDSLGFFDHASIVCAGLELDEYFRIGEVASLIGEIRKVYDGKIATHQKPGKWDYSAHADICFYQINPGQSIDWIHEKARQMSIGGKPILFHEIERQPARDKCEAALSGGAFGVGNW